MHPVTGAPRIAILLLLILCLFAANPGHAQTAVIRIGGERFELEIAADPGSRAQGLMFRESIATSGGMLFIFPDEAARSFWMKNCLVDMDLLFLDSRGVILTIHQMSAEPPKREEESWAAYHARLPRYPSTAPARFAVELRHGTAARLGIVAGERVSLDTHELGALAR